MLKKRFTSLFLALSMVLGLGTSAFAFNDRQGAEENLSDYDEVVVFCRDAVATCADTSSTDSYHADIENAKAGVLALNLSEQGLAALEDACLNELDAMADLEGVTLNEYTVLVPKSRAISYTYYGTYSGVQFYTTLSSKKSVTYEKNNIGAGEKVIQWSKAAINLYMCFANYKVSLPWTILSADFPTNFTVHKTAWIEYFANAEPITRSIYAKSGSAYLHVYNREYGNFRPYLVYHTNDMLDEPVYTASYPQRAYPDLDATTSAAALKEAYQQYVNEGFRNITMENSTTFKWE